MNKKLDRNYYDTLEIERTADEVAIKKAYKRAALQHHPDKGGTDDMFQQVNEAWQVLQDPVKRADYDRDLKKYNLKDGTGLKKAGAKPAKRADSTTDAAFSRQGTTDNDFEKQAKFQKQTSFVEIPSNLSSLSIKDLKQILEGLGIRSEDCFEKNDLINRIKEYQDNKKSAKEQKPQPNAGRRQSEAAPQQSKENKKPPAHSNSTTYGQTSTPAAGMPTIDQVSFKIISMGNSEVGKSCLIKKYCEEKFVERYISTIGIDYGVKKLKIKGQQVCINFFDMSGNEDYKLIRTEFYPDASGVLMVFDLDNRDSYNSLVHWEDEMKKSGVEANRTKVVVCGNKSDSKGREVNSKEAQKWAKQRGYEYFETSASTGQNVSEAFLTLFELCLAQFQAERKQFGL